MVEIFAGFAHVPNAVSIAAQKQPEKCLSIVITVRQKYILLIFVEYL